MTQICRRLTGLMLAPKPSEHPQHMLNFDVRVVIMVERELSPDDTILQQDATACKKAVAVCVGRSSSHSKRDAQNPHTATSTPLEPMRRATAVKQACNGGQDAIKGAKNPTATFKPLEAMRRVRAVPMRHLYSGLSLGMRYAPSSRRMAALLVYAAAAS